MSTLSDEALQRQLRWANDQVTAWEDELLAGRLAPPAAYPADACRHERVQWWLCRMQSPPVDGRNILPFYPPAEGDPHNPVLEAVLAKLQLWCDTMGWQLIDGNGCCKEHLRQRVRPCTMFFTRNDWGTTSVTLDIKADAASLQLLELWLRATPELAERVLLADVGTHKPQLLLMD